MPIYSTTADHVRLRAKSYTELICMKQQIEEARLDSTTIEKVEKVEQEIHQRMPFLKTPSPTTSYRPGLFGNSILPRKNLAKRAAPSEQLAVQIVPWTSVPVEIQLQILRLCLVADSPIVNVRMRRHYRLDNRLVARDRHLGQWDITPGILLISKHLYGEGLRMLYTCNTFQYLLRPPPGRPNRNQVPICSHITRAEGHAWGGEKNNFATLKHLEVFQEPPRSDDYIVTILNLIYTLTNLETLRCSFRYGKPKNQGDPNTVFTPGLDSKTFIAGRMTLVPGFELDLDDLNNNRELVEDIQIIASKFQGNLQPPGRLRLIRSRFAMALLLFALSVCYLLPSLRTASLAYSSHLISNGIANRGSCLKYFIKTPTARCGSAKSRSTNSSSRSGSYMMNLPKTALVMTLKTIPEDSI